MFQTGRADSIKTDGQNPRNKSRNGNVSWGGWLWGASSSGRGAMSKEKKPETAMIKEEGGVEDLGLFLP